MSQGRRKHGPAFKAKVALDALNGQEAVARLAASSAAAPAPTSTTRCPPPQAGYLLPRPSIPVVDPDSMRKSFAASTAALPGRLRGRGDAPRARQRSGSADSGTLE